MDALPPWSSVLAVVAHPDDETFGLGGVIGAFASAGAMVEVVSFTRGEASTLGQAEDLGEVRSREMREAASILGIGRITLLDHPDGGLSDLSDLLDAHIAAVVEDTRPDGLLVFGPGGITGHPDHVSVSRAAVSVAERHGIGVLGFVISEPVAARLRDTHAIPFVGAEAADLRVVVDRDRQLEACERHQSQMNPVVVERLQITGPEEWLVWMVAPG